VNTSYIATTTYQSPLGELLLGSYKGKLVLCDWLYRRQRKSIDKRLQQGFNSSYKDEESSIAKETIKQLEEYFKGKRKDFSIPIYLQGSDFQCTVWKELQQLPYGTTCSYLSLSEKLGNTKAIRAVAAANGANAISILVPCHRIIGSNGELIGYAGGLSCKKKLLQLENPGLYKEQLSLF
jgi:methylated-DNA-[protein]-cysteine S-methyltransferase